MATCLYCTKLYCTVLGESRRQSHCQPNLGSLAGLEEFTVILQNPTTHSEVMEVNDNLSTVFNRTELWSESTELHVLIFQHAIFFPKGLNVLQGLELYSVIVL